MDSTLNQSAQSEEPTLQEYMAAVEKLAFAPDLPPLILQSYSGKTSTSPLSPRGAYRTQIKSEP